MGRRWPTLFRGGARKTGGRQAAHPRRAAAHCHQYRQATRTQPSLSREACAANLVIIGRERLSADPFRSLDPGALLLPVGRPVLLVPTGLNHLHANRIAVAWKDTREARRALSDSLPFLHDAEKVFLVEVCTEHEAKAVQHRMSNISSVPTLSAAIMISY